MNLIELFRTIEGILKEPVIDTWNQVIAYYMFNEGGGPKTGKKYHDNKLYLNIYDTFVEKKVGILLFFYYQLISQTKNECFQIIRTS